ncbi:MAG: 1,5-anhydro-D-fructose reductase [Firmicutes bacterium ADurb.Bin300]|nr:MAG: 1,5-anhydro-D-fructose reductase [Firmicutes bacterium ADurb.Bin300]
MNVAFAGFRHGHLFSALEYIRTVPDINIVASWEIDASSKEEAKRHAVEITHEDYDEMLRLKDIDIVVIGDYYSARGEKTIKALKSGRHVYTDKPVCTSLDELGEIERLTKEKNLCLGCILDLRCCSAAAAAKETVKSGSLGKIHNISFGGQHALNYGSRPGWYFEKGKHGGTINDIAVHGIDLIRYITGKGLKEVLAARCWNAYAEHEPDFLDSAQLMAVFEESTGVIADVSYSMPYPISYKVPQSWRFTFWGENGIMEFNGSDDFVTLSLKGSKEAQKVFAMPATVNPFEDFIMEINGSPTALCTREIIRASKDTLEIQKRSRT